MALRFRKRRRSGHRGRARNGRVPDAVSAIVRAATRKWRTVALIVATVILDRRHQSIDVSALAERVNVLVAAGRLDAQGDLDRIRHSAVRLPAQSRPGTDMQDAVLALDEHERSGLEAAP
ncbi:hypothetical protein CIW48_03045 [Methylobacterium sp. P1-11]|uniref:DUF3658 domain-containing protein n=1 Tax=Methylobacterium sp. P1-11 TaxID=2024616 RepID=UPI0011F046A5|nr:DUF3658 domain-containing protein [Methylobacterium sp. P1-11]KAA0125324.1 hypothetical protein CIW48_03045 [Methylobacterium sp. P1-11]